MKKLQTSSFITLIMCMISCSNSVAINEQKERVMTTLVNTNELREECNGMEIYLCPNLIQEWDKGYKKWAIVLKNFESIDASKCEIKRLFQQRTEDGFSPLGSGLFPVAILKRSENVEIKETDFYNVESLAYPTVVFSERGFLPGEKITIRAKNKGITHYDTITFYPLPLILKDSSGNELMNAELVSLCPTTYDLKIAYNPSNRLVKFGSYKEDEKEEYVYQTEPLSAFCTVINDGTTGGINKLTFFYQDGNSYEIDLPWGTELNPYVQGKVSSLDK